MRGYLERARAGETVGGELLTAREEEIVKLVASRTPTTRSAEMLVISKSVERRRASILEKLCMRDRVELARDAIRRGLVSPDGR